MLSSRTGGCNIKTNLNLWTQQTLCTAKTQCSANTQNGHKAFSTFPWLHHSSYNLAKEIRAKRDIQCFVLLNKSLSSELSFTFVSSLSVCIRGFCYFNSIAIAAKQLQHKLSVCKILIVDWVRQLVSSVLMLVFSLLLCILKKTDCDNSVIMVCSVTACLWHSMVNLSPVLLTMYYNIVSSTTCGL